MQFTQGLHRAAQQKPEVLATACLGRTRTYRELHDRVGRLGGGFNLIGLGRGDRIGVLSLNSDRYLESYLAIAWIGAVAVPANFRWSLAEIIYSLQDAGVSALIVDDQFAKLADEIRAACPGIRSVIFAGDGEAPQKSIQFEDLAQGGRTVPDVEAGGDDVFGIFYTGGTTGAPKGVVLTHLNMCMSGLAMMAEGPFPEGSVGLHAAPMFHLADMLMVTGLLLRGASHVMMPVFKPETVLELIERHGVTDTLLVPTMLQMVVDFPGLVGRDTTSLQRILYGASPASEALLDRAMQAFPGVEFMQGYGMTETAAFVSLLPASMHMPEGRKFKRLRSCGRSSYHIRMRVVDADDHELPRGEIGEIVARGPNIMKEYLNRPDETAHAKRNGWMHTGDMGYMDEEGYVFIVDRMKDMIISGGENVYSIEVENAVAKHPAVIAAAVVGVPCPERGEKIHAVVVLRPGSSLTLEELQAHCKTLIAGYKCPRSLDVRENLPMSGAGKILKTELRKPFWRDMDRAVS